MYLAAERPVTDADLAPEQRREVLTAIAQAMVAPLAAPAPAHREQPTVLVPRRAMVLLPRDGGPHLCRVGAAVVCSVREP